MGNGQFELSFFLFFNYTRRSSKPSFFPSLFFFPNGAILFFSFKEDFYFILPKLSPTLTLTLSFLREFCTRNYERLSIRTSALEGREDGVETRGYICKHILLYFQLGGFLTLFMNDATSSVVFKALGFENPHKDMKRIEFAFLNPDKTNVVVLVPMTSEIACNHVVVICFSSFHLSLCFYYYSTFLFSSFCL